MKRKKDGGSYLPASKCEMLITAAALTISHITGGLLLHCKLILPGCVNLSCAVLPPILTPQSAVVKDTHRA